jgi:DUF971 family protein
MDRLLHSSSAGSIAAHHDEDQVTPLETEVLEITNVQLVSRYALKLDFSDATQRVIDFEPFLKASRNPAIRAYLDYERFSHFRLEYGDLVWDDYDLCFPIADLYSGKV